MPKTEKNKGGRPRKSEDEKLHFLGIRVPKLVLEELDKEPQKDLIAARDVLVRWAKRRRHR